MFNEIADLLGILGENHFKILAYRRAARNLMENIEPIVKRGASVQQFKAMPGIGNAIAEKMMEYLETKKISYLTDLRKQVPKSVRQLLDIPGLGPGRVRKLFLNLGIQNKSDLMQAAANGDIAELPGFGGKLVDQILIAIEKGQEKKKRHEREGLKTITSKIIKVLKKVKGISKIEVAGSYRRGAKTVGDLDILVCGEAIDGKAIAGALTETFPNHTVLAQGDTKFSFVMFPRNLQVDVRFVVPESWGAALLYFTGSKDFNVEMRKIAISKGYLLNEYGLFNEGEYIAGETEAEVFKALGMKAIKPENRK